MNTGGTSSKRRRIGDVGGSVRGDVRTDDYADIDETIATVCRQYALLMEVAEKYDASHIPTHEMTSYDRARMKLQSLISPGMSLFPMFRS